jgi:AraC-like DNA-binding protein
MTFNSIERLGRPFRSVSEVGLAIPADGEAVVRNPEFKVLFFLQGDCAQEIGQEGTYATKAGDIFVIPRRCEQRYRRLPERRAAQHVHALKISFDLPPVGETPAGARRPAPEDPEGDLTDFVRHYFVGTRHLPGGQTPAMQEILRGIRREAEEHGPGIRHRVRALCTNLVVHVARQLYAFSPQIAQADGHGPLANQVKEFLFRNYARSLTLGEIAWQVKKSDEHVARIFRKVTGQTVFDYLRTIRLESAKTLLIDSELTLSEIAARTGFSSLALFSRNFSAYVGQSASDYRRKRAETVRW